MIIGGSPPPVSPLSHELRAGGRVADDPPAPGQLVAPRVRCREIPRSAGVLALLEQPHRIVIRLLVSVEQVLKAQHPEHLVQRTNTDPLARVDAAIGLSDPV